MKLMHERRGEGMKISNVPTDKLIQELISRENVTAYRVGPYQPYELKRRYDSSREAIAPSEKGTILFIR